MTVDFNDIFLDWDSPAIALPYVMRTGMAALAGALIGLQREYRGKAAGLRTHIIIAMGAAATVGAALQFDATSDGIARVIQGIMTGMGFVGAGTILKLTEARRIQGLTTAASLWLTASLGVGYALGLFWGPTVLMFAALLVLTILGRLEDRLGWSLDSAEDVP